jgi:hypothetical protein
MASQEDVRWARVKSTAARWFARLEADQRRCATGPRPRPSRAAIDADVPELDPADVVEIVPATACKRR